MKWRCSICESISEVGPQGRLIRSTHPPLEVSQNCLLCGNFYLLASGMMEVLERQEPSLFSSLTEDSVQSFVTETAAWYLLRMEKTLQACFRELTKVSVNALFNGVPNDLIEKVRERDELGIEDFVDWLYAKAGEARGG